MIDLIFLDFNGDQLINGDDVEQVVQALTRNELSQDEIAIVREKVLEEADIDDDKCISFSEFRHVISRAPEFLKLVFFLLAKFLFPVNVINIFFRFCFSVHFICESKLFQIQKKETDIVN